MRTIPAAAVAVPALQSCTLFAALDPAHLPAVAQRAGAWALDDGEVLVHEGDASDVLFLVAEGALTVIRGGVVLARLGVGNAAGEMGILLGEPRTASLRAHGPTVVLVLTAEDVRLLLERLPGFGAALCRVLARRLGDASHRVPVAVWEGDATRPDPAAAELLPREFICRYRVLPLAIEGATLTIGCVGDPRPDVLAAVASLHPSLELTAVRIPAASLDTWLDRATTADTRTAGPSDLDALLRRMVEEGASDLHLSAGQSPWWRVGGDLRPVPDAGRLGGDDVLRLLTPTMDPRVREAFLQDHDVDYAATLAASGRFRVNVFRDHHGVSAVIRQIPSKILSFEQLRLPPAVLDLCEHARGLVLVTGPTGCGKSTTLAAMIDRINQTRPAHILTFEDPIEHVHPSRMALVNQREVGTHTASFARALQAALREDPDVVVIGELRDRDTAQRALEIAHTGHLVLGTLPTGTAQTTIDWLIDLFPPDQHGAIRSLLADVLRGVICQTLCRRLGGGRIAALEILVASSGLANLIREGRTSQIPVQMEVGRSAGNQLLVDALEKLVHEHQVDPEEALSRAINRGELTKRLAR